MPLLELDCGNSNIKYRCVDLGVNNHCSLEQLSGVFNGLAKDKTTSIERINISSVLNDSKNKLITDSCKQYFKVSPYYASVINNHLGFYGAYQNIGVDRWLCSLAAYHRQQGAVMIIDAGTATTLDAVDSNGQYLGGYIVPGMTTLSNSLLQADKIDIEYNQLDANVELGHSTTLCVNNGCLQMTVSFILQTWLNVKRQHPTMTLYICGGHTSKIMPFIQECQPQHQDSLIFEGLSLALPLQPEVK